MTPDSGSDGRRRGPSRPRGAPWLTLAVAAVVSAVFALQLRFAPEACFENVAFPARCAAKGLLDQSTLAFVLLPSFHGYTGHLVTNVVLVVFFGSYFEHRHPRTTYLVFLVVAGYGSILVQLLLDVLAGRPPLALGLSGAVFAVGASFAVDNFPRSLAEVRTLPTVEITYCSLGWAVVGFALATHLSVLSTAPTTATSVHVVGAAVGLGYGVAVRSDVVPRVASAALSGDP